MIEKFLPCSIHMLSSARYPNLWTERNTAIRARLLKTLRATRVKRVLLSSVALGNHACVTHTESKTRRTLPFRYNKQTLLH